MIALTPEASAQLDKFERRYTEQRRPQALCNLGHLLAEASLIILNAPRRGLSAPCPYPELASLDLLWLKRGRYWIAYDPAGPVIAGVFFDTADIPNRVSELPAAQDGASMNIALNDASFWDGLSDYRKMAHAFTSPYAERAWEEAALPAHAEILDIAAGAGALALVAARAGARVLATDFPLEWLKA